LENQFLEVSGIDVFYGDVQVLWDVSFSAQEGLISVFVGANGAGKTTLLKTISGLMKPRRGEIRFAHRSLLELSPEQIVDLGISHVPEGRRIFTKLTVLENLKLGAYLPRARADLSESLKTVYSLFPVLEERKNQLAGSLSGGEQQMLAIGRALMAKPRLLILDEPSLGLSPLVVKTIFNLLKVLKEKGITILLVEQNVHQALRIADYAFVLKNGKIVMEGIGEQLLTNREIQEAYIGRRV
jgi:branched-chain amino acid transport system ATP-binding protein